MKEIYILHVDNQIAFYKPSKKCPSYGFAPSGTFVSFIEELIKEYPEYKLRCIRNEGLENWLRERKKATQNILQQNNKNSGR